MYRCALTVSIVLAALGTPALGFEFIPGDFYGTNYSSNVIVHYDQAGNVTQSLTIPGALADDVKGLAFGPDNLLYAVAKRGSGFAVLALSEAGVVQQTYPFANNYIGGNISYGKIAFGAGHFYVGGGGGLVRFDYGDANSGTKIRTAGTYDVECLPSGNLLALQNYDLYEVTPDGALVREINPVGIYFTDNRGVEYDPGADVVYVSMLGHSGNFHQVMKLAAASGQLLDQTTFNYADDMFLTREHNLVVGSRTQSPGLFTTDLEYLGSFGGDDRMFITQFVPEPGSIWLAVLATTLATTRRRT